MLLIVDFSRDVIYLIIAFLNPYFAWIYGIVYGCLLIIFLAAVVLIFLYLFGRKENQQYLTYGLLLASIAGILMSTWMIIYIVIIYPYPYVLIHKKYSWDVRSGMVSEDGPMDVYEEYKGHHAKKGYPILLHGEA